MIGGGKGGDDCIAGHPPPTTTTAAAAAKGAAASSHFRGGFNGIHRNAVSQCAPARVFTFLSLFRRTFCFFRFRFSLS